MPKPPWIPKEFERIVIEHKQGPERSDWYASKKYPWPVGGAGGSSNNSSRRLGTVGGVLAGVAILAVGGMAMIGYREFRDHPELRTMTPDELRHYLETQAPSLKKEFEDGLKEDVLKKGSQSILKTSQTEPVDVEPAEPVGDIAAAAEVTAMAGAAAGSVAASNAVALDDPTGNPIIPVGTVESKGPEVTEIETAATSAKPPAEIKPLKNYGWTVGEPSSSVVDMSGDAGGGGSLPSPVLGPAMPTAQELYFNQILQDTLNGAFNSAIEGDDRVPVESETPNEMTPSSPGIE